MKLRTAGGSPRREGQRPIGEDDLRTARAMDVDTPIFGARLTRRAMEEILSAIAPVLVD